MSSSLDILSLPTDLHVLIGEKLNWKDRARLGMTCSSFQIVISCYTFARAAFIELKQKIPSESCLWSKQAMQKIDPKKDNCEKHLVAILPWLYKPKSEFVTYYYPLSDIIEKLSINFDHPSGPCVCQIE